MLLLCASLAAQELKVGDTAADFSPANWINPPAYGSFEELRGDVILLKAWGKDAKASVDELPAMNAHAAKPGLHVVSLYTHVHKFSELEALISKHNIKYPIALDSFWPAGYAASTVPRVWIVGTDGKIKFIGESGFEKVLEEELAKVKYPGLGKDSVASALEPAAKLFAEGKFADAYAAARALLDSGDEATRDDAEALIERVDERIRALRIRAEDAEGERDFSLAMRCWEEMSRYKGIEDAAEGPEKLKKLQDSAEAKKEIKARRDLISLRFDLAIDFRKIDRENARQLKSYRQRALRVLQKFATENKETAAGERAAEYAEEFEALLEEE